MREERDCRRSTAGRWPPKTITLPDQTYLARLHPYSQLTWVDLHDFKGEKRPAREQHVVLASPDEVRRALKRAQRGLGSGDDNNAVAASAG